MVGEPLARLLAAPSLFRTSHYRALPYINPPKIKHLCSGPSTECIWVSVGSRIWDREREWAITVHVNESVRADSMLELKKRSLSYIMSKELYLYTGPRSLLLPQVIFFLLLSWSLKATIPFACPCVLHTGYIALPHWKKIVILFHVFSPAIVS